MKRENDNFQTLDNISEQGESAVSFAESYLRLPHERREGIPSTLDTNEIVHGVETYFLSPEVSIGPLEQKFLILELFDDSFQKFNNKSTIPGPDFLRFVDDWLIGKEEELSSLDQEISSSLLESLSSINLTKIRDIAKSEFLEAENFKRNSPPNFAEADITLSKWRKVMFASNKAYDYAEFVRKQRKRKDKRYK